jgi:hypothetical protein
LHNNKAERRRPETEQLSGHREWSFQAIGILHEVRT